MNVGEIVATTLRRRRRQITDNMSNHGPLFRQMREFGGLEPAPGGRTLFEPVDLAENATVTWYAGHEQLNIIPQETIDGADFDWKHVAISVNWSGPDEAKNSGPDALINLLRAKTMNAERSLINELARAMFFSGTENSGKSVGGLPFLVPTDPTSGIVGGINRAVDTGWQSQTNDVTTEFNDSDALPGHMTDSWLSTVFGSEHPTLIVTNDVGWKTFNSSLTPIQRITGPQTGARGFSDLTFYGPGGSAPVMFDGQCPADRMWFLNMRFVKLRPHANRNIQTRPPVRSMNQDAEVTLLYWSGNMTLSASRVHGLLWT